MGDARAARESVSRDRWSGRPGTVGTVAVVGLGKIGLPLAAKYASAGWTVIGVDVAADVVRSFATGRSHIPEEPGVEALLATAHAAGRLHGTTSHAEAASRSDVVVIIVPVMLDAGYAVDYRTIDAASAAVGAGLRPGTLVIYETTLPVGTTRDRLGRILETSSGVPIGGDGLLLAFSPERVFSGRVLADLDAYPKLVGGVDEVSADRTVAFYRSVLSADVWDMGSAETAELAKLAETTYRDVNIAFANELAGYAATVGVDVLEVIRAANSQPFSHIHRPGIGVGGHCIPVYPRFLMGGDDDLPLVRTARRVNDDQVARAVDELERHLGGLRREHVLVLGLTYREHVRELAYSRAIPLIEILQARGADVTAYDPLLHPEEVIAAGARPYRWGDESPASAIVTQTADPLWEQLDHRWFPRLRIVYDGRNSLDRATLPSSVLRVGVGRSPGRKVRDAVTESPV